MKSKRSSTPRPEIIAKYSRTSKSPYQCKDCDYTSTDMGPLVMHSNRRHLGTVKTWNQHGSNGKLTKKTKRTTGKWSLDLERQQAAEPPAAETQEAEAGVTLSKNGHRMGRPRKNATLTVPHWKICPNCGVDIELAARAYAVITQQMHQ